MKKIMGILIMTSVLPVTAGTITNIACEAGPLKKVDITIEKNCLTLSVHKNRCPIAHCRYEDEGVLDHTFTTCLGYTQHSELTISEENIPRLGTKLFIDAHSTKCLRPGCTDYLASIDLALSYAGSDPNVWKLNALSTSAKGSDYVQTDEHYVLPTDLQQMKCKVI